jgi:hypothetical protein
MKSFVFLIEMVLSFGGGRPRPSPRTEELSCFQVRLRFTEDGPPEEEHVYSFVDYPDCLRSARSDMSTCHRTQNMTLLTERTSIKFKRL